MPLQILSSPPPDPATLVVQLRERIEASIPDCEVDVVAESPGHFSLTVVSSSFAPRWASSEPSIACCCREPDVDHSP